MGSFANLDIDEGIGSQNIVLEQRRQEAAMWVGVYETINVMEIMLAAAAGTGGPNELVSTLSGTSAERTIPSPGSPPGAYGMTKADYETAHIAIVAIKANLDLVVDATLRAKLGPMLGPVGS